VLTKKNKKKLLLFFLINNFCSSFSDFIVIDVGVAEAAFCFVQSKQTLAACCSSVIAL